MAQHFRLSAASRTLSLKEIYKGGEAKAKAMFQKLRWPETNGQPVCPKCDCERSYDVPSRNRFKCAACHHQYSITSGTIFASRKMDFTDLLAAITIIINSAKGVSMVQLSRDLDCQYKTAFVLAHKLREAMAQEERNQQPGQGSQDSDRRASNRDPLGRDQGSNGATGSDNEADLNNDAYGRARELLDEIRRRSGEAARPEVERDYLNRLLDRF